MLETFMGSLVVPLLLLGRFPAGFASDFEDSGLT